MTNWLERLWYPAAGERLTVLQGLALLLLLPLSWLFTAVAAQRRRGLARQAAASPVPTLIVGNLSVGGTGKTPLVIALIRRLQTDGFRIGVISRGYGSEPQGGAGYPLGVGQYPDASIVGDEPLLIHHATGAPVYVDPDRPRARQALLHAHHCDLVISDDGLQHYALSRDFELVVIDAKRGLGNGHCLPAGPLREPPSRLRDIDAIIVNEGAIKQTASKQHSEGQAVADAERRGRSETLPGLTASNTATTLAGRCWPMTLATERLRPLLGHEAEPSSADLGSPGERQLAPPQPGESITAVAGIGNPSRFFDTLRALGYKVVECPFPDHHDFQAADFSDLQGPVVMTEKDAVKCRALLADRSQQFWVLGVSAILPEGLYQQILHDLLGVAKPDMR
ncbi:tetraacyldisaccharide 4'-kinase [Allohahella marinimesophila]|uniref:Tetraacyldisaccharide 4'-kinase n=1 Tax=Allohahella marinimesophila TaxID=1054972 RepID=A0ABP7Q8I6_9GAMM